MQFHRLKFDLLLSLTVVKLLILRHAKNNMNFLDLNYLHLSLADLDLLLADLNLLLSQLNLMWKFYWLNNIFVKKQLHFSLAFEEKNLKVLSAGGLFKRLPTTTWAKTSNSSDYQA